MKVSEAIEQLQKCNPDARVVISLDVTYSEYTSGTEHVDIASVIGWPEPLETAMTVELCHDH